MRELVTHASSCGKSMCVLLMCICWLPICLQMSPPAQEPPQQNDTDPDIEYLETVPKKSLAEKDSAVQESTQMAQATPEGNLNVAKVRQKEISQSRDQLFCSFRKSSPERLTHDKLVYITDPVASSLLVTFTSIMRSSQSSNASASENKQFYCS